MVSMHSTITGSTALSVSQHGPGSCLGFQVKKKKKERREDRKEKKDSRNAAIAGENKQPIKEERSN